MSLEISREEEEEEEEDTLVSLDALLPDDLLEKTLSLLPISSIRNASLVSKRWRAVVQCLWPFIPPSETSLFFIFTYTRRFPLEGQMYNPNLRRWSTARFPSIEDMRLNVVASSGLVCVMGGRDPTRPLFVCNPVIGEQKQLPHGPLFSRHSFITIAMSIDRQINSYTVDIICFKRCTGNYDVTVHVYESKTQSWVVALTQSFPWFEHNSVICNEFLYSLFTTDNLWYPDVYLLVYDLRARPRSKSFVLTRVPAPPSLFKPFPSQSSQRISSPTRLSPTLSNPWLMNMREKVVMVAMICDEDKPFRMMASLGVWVLGEKEWREVSKITLKSIQQRFGNEYFMLSCRGADDFIHVYCYYSRFVTSC